jgi:hypothetical protein
LEKPWLKAVSIDFGTAFFCWKIPLSINGILSVIFDSDKRCRGLKRRRRWGEKRGPLSINALFHLISNEKGIYTEGSPFELSNVFQIPFFEVLMLKKNDTKLVSHIDCKLIWHLQNTTPYCAYI